MEEATTTITLDGKTKYLSLRIENKIDTSFLYFSPNKVLEVARRAIAQE